MDTLETILKHVIETRIKEFHRAWHLTDRTPSASAGDVVETARLEGRLIELVDFAGILFGTQFKEDMQKLVYEIVP